MDSIPEQSAQPLLPAKVSPGVFTSLVRRWFARFCRRGGIFVGLLALILFYHAAGFGFLTWGDGELATDLPPISLGIFDKGLTAAFKAVTPWDGNFGPLAPISHALDFQLFGRKPLPAHLTNVWLHVFNVILLFAVVRQFGKSVWVAALAAAIFALHPLQVAPVAWVSQRRILLATLFVLAAVWCWLRVARPSRSPPVGVPPTGSRDRTTVWWHLAAVGSCLLAVLSYPASGVLILLVTIILWSPSRAIESLGWPAGRRPYVVLAQAPVWIIAITILVWSLVKTAPWNVGAAENSSFQLRNSMGLAAVHVVDVFSTLARSLWKIVTLGSVSPTFNLEAGNEAAGDLWLAVGGMALLVVFWFLPPLPGPLLPPREEREKKNLAVGTQGGSRFAPLPWAIIFRPFGAAQSKMRGCAIGLVWFLVCGVAAVFTAREDAFAPVQ